LERQPFCPLFTPSVVATEANIAAPADAAADPRAGRDRLTLKINLTAQYIHFWSASASRVTPPLLGAAVKALSAGWRFRSSGEAG
jgi:hypothetical protein